MSIKERKAAEQAARKLHESRLHAAFKEQDRDALFWAGEVYSPKLGRVASIKTFSARDYAEDDRGFLRTPYGDENEFVIISTIQEWRKVTPMESGRVVGRTHSTCYILAAGSVEKKDRPDGSVECKAATDCLYKTYNDYSLLRAGDVITLNAPEDWSGVDASYDLGHWLGD